jgi:hypothetical protein
MNDGIGRGGGPRLLVSLLPDVGVHALVDGGPAETFAECYREAWDVLPESDRNELLRIWEALRNTSDRTRVPEIVLTNKGSWLVHFGTVAEDAEHEGEDLYDITFYRQDSAEAVAFWGRLLDELPRSVITNLVLIHLAETMVRYSQPDLSDPSRALHEQLAAWGRDIGPLRGWMEKHQEFLQGLIASELERLEHDGDHGGD